ncbi:MAG TPA: HNH endonuclease, partial [Actinomycetota bacterium]
MGRALVLNASESPLAVVAARRAVVMVLKEKADVILSNGMVFHSARLTIEAPSVVRLRRYVHVPYRPHAPLTRRAVFARDLGTCQYCGA